jgi:hypothetical protein
MLINPRLIAWYALVFFLVLTILVGLLLVQQNTGSNANPVAQSAPAPSINLNNLFGL